VNCVKKLSEKGYEQRSKRGFRRCREAKMGLKVPLRCSVRLHRRLFRPFSDGFKAKFAQFTFYALV
jgi:hypothetical protein